jgi:NADH-quinone oxidoreductase subunit L
MLLWTILLPLFGFVLLGLWGRRMAEPLPGVVASLLVAGSFALGLGLLVGGGATFEVADWLPGIAFSLKLDALSGLMLLVVSGIGLLIHIYAIGYMHGDPGFSRFFAYLNLFIAMMLTLVLADNYAVMFIGWEGVGLASYLLIGFWYRDRVNSDSARKAFIVNRIGDLGFLLGMGLLYSLFGTLSISGLAKEFGGELVIVPAGLSLVAFLLFVGAVGKSAQVPLMTWLPDAMAGPTPVSALIHAATMVTAGVYLIARSSFIFANTPDVGLWIAVIGLVTAAYGALSAFGQNDIKKIVAFSTISQLGFMFVAAGVGAYWAALFHVVTHAFFKALLFMTSGSVIHALGGEQDIRKMGGLRKYLPTTHLHGLIGALALGGFPLLAGFWSKDAILAYTFGYEGLGVVLWLGLLAVAFLTAAYSMRWYVTVFLGEYRGKAHPHESPAVMLVPNHILAIGAVLAGLLGLPKVLPFGHILEEFLGKTVTKVEHAELGVATEWGLILVSAVVGLSGLALGYRFFQRSVLPAWFTAFQRPSAESFYIDQVYNSLLVNPLKGLAGLLLDGDRGLLRAFSALGPLAQGVGGWLARLETGNLRSYAAVIVLAIAALVVWGVLR